MNEKETFEEWLKSKNDMKATPFRKEVCNQFYYVLKNQEIGKHICAEAIAEEIGYVKDKKIKKGHIGEAVRLLRKYDKMPNLCSGKDGYWLDSSKEGMVGALRYIVTKIATLKRTAENMRDTINRVHGAGSVPEDVELWLYLENLEEWCNEKGIDFDEYVDKHGINR